MYIVIKSGQNNNMQKEDLHKVGYDTGTCIGSQVTQAQAGKCSSCIITVMAKNNYRSLYGNIYNLLGTGSLGSHNLLKWPCFSKVNSHDSKFYTVVIR